MNSGLAVAAASASKFNIAEFVTILSGVAGVVIAFVSLILSTRASRKASDLASEQEHLRRVIRTDALYSLMATYDLLDELSSYVWMSAQEKRVDREYVISFLTLRVDELSRIHNTAAYFFWKRATSSFLEQRPIGQEPLAQILGQGLADKDLARKLAEWQVGVGEALVALESNHWISSIDALYRLKSYTLPEDLTVDGRIQNGESVGEKDAPAKELLDRLGPAALSVLKPLLNYFDRTGILRRLLAHYEPELSIHIDEFARKSTRSLR